MIQKLIVLMILCFVTGPAFADPIADRYFTNKNPALSNQEKHALDLAKQWKSGGIPAHSESAGIVRYVYGVQQPSIVCAVLQVCDVALQPGEVVNSLHIGDSARWLIEPAVTGAAPNEIQHLIIKPLDVGLQTSLVVTTDRRTYHMQLKSHRTEYMPRVAFAYPEEAYAKWDALKLRQQAVREDRTIPQTGEYLGDLNFEYDVSGSARWKPVRVFNDGIKTVIQMPSVMAQTEAPTLLVIRQHNGQDAETVIVNYRLQNDRFIVDSVFDKAILIAGVGRKQDKITITRREGGQ